MDRVQLVNAWEKLLAEFRRINGEDLSVQGAIRNDVLGNVSIGGLVCSEADRLHVVSQRAGRLLLNTPVELSPVTAATTDDLSRWIAYIGFDCRNGELNPLNDDLVHLRLFDPIPAIETAVLFLIGECERSDDSESPDLWLTLEEIVSRGIIPNEVQTIANTMSIKRGDYPERDASSRPIRYRLTSFIAWYEKKFPGNAVCLTDTKTADT